MRTIPIAVTICLTFFASATASAQLMDRLKGAVGGGQSETQGSSALGSLPSVSQAGPGNMAGVLQYCIKNNYLEGGGATSVSNSLLGKVNGQGTTDSSYQSGSRGMLDTGNGQNYSLGGGGIKQQITQKVCDLVLQRGKSLL